MEIVAKTFGKTYLRLFIAIALLAVHLGFISGEAETGAPETLLETPEVASSEKEIEKSLQKITEEKNVAEFAKPAQAIAEKTAEDAPKAASRFSNAKTRLKNSLRATRGKISRYSQIHALLIVLLVLIRVGIIGHNIGYMKDIVPISEISHMLSGVFYFFPMFIRDSAPATLKVFILLFVLLKDVLFVRKRMFAFAALLEIAVIFFVFNGFGYTSFLSALENSRMQYSYKVLMVVVQELLFTFCLISGARNCPSSTSLNLIKQVALLSATLLVLSAAAAAILALSQSEAICNGVFLSGMEAIRFGMFAATTKLVTRIYKVEERERDRNRKLKLGALLALNVAVLVATLYLPSHENAVYLFAWNMVIKSFSSVFGDAFSFLKARMLLFTSNVLCGLLGMGGAASKLARKDTNEKNLKTDPISEAQKIE